MSEGTPDKPPMSWERKALLIVGVVAAVALVVKFGAEILILLGLGATGSYTYSARKRVELAKSNAEKADKAADKYKRTAEAVKTSRKKLDEVRTILAAREATKATVDWDKESSAPPPTKLED